MVNRDEDEDAVVTRDEDDDDAVVSTDEDDAVVSLAPHSRNVLGSGPDSHCVESALLVFLWVFLQVFLPQFPSTVQGRADLADWSVCVCPVWIHGHLIDRDNS